MSPPSFTLYAQTPFLMEKQPSEKSGGTINFPPLLGLMLFSQASSSYNQLLSLGRNVKCFHNPKTVLFLHNHFPTDCLGGYCRTYSVVLQLILSTLYQCFVGERSMVYGQQCQCSPHKNTYINPFSKSLLKAASVCWDRMYPNFKITQNQC